MSGRSVSDRSVSDRSVQGESEKIKMYEIMFDCFCGIVWIDIFEFWKSWMVFFN